MQIQFSFKIDPRDEFGHFIKALEDEVYLELSDYLEGITAEITDWMKENAVWVDRTGAAREDLRAELADFTNRSLEILLSYDPIEERESGERHYAIYLETIQAGKYAILGPTLDEWGPRILADVQEILSSIGASRIKYTGGRRGR